jgi:hypothetical protein
MSILRLSDTLPPTPANLFLLYRSKLICHYHFTSPPFTTQHFFVAWLLKRLSFSRVIKRRKKLPFPFNLT